MRIPDRAGRNTPQAGDTASQADLARIAAATETLGRSATARAADHAVQGVPRPDAPAPADPAEIWGRRIGRGAGLVLLVALAIWLAAYLAR